MSVYNSSLIEIDRELSSNHQNIALTGTDLSIADIIAVARKNAVVDFSSNPEILRKIQDSYEHMLKDIENGIPIYGCNTGYGAQASRVLIKGTPEERLAIARQISEGIAHVDMSVGPLFTKDIVRAGILIRINMIMGGVSAVKLADLELYRKLLNHQVTPVVNQYGGIGASGDLAHNGRVLSVLRRLPGSKVWDKNDHIREAEEVLNEEKISLLELDPKAGLGLVNGDNFSTGLAALLAYDTIQSLLLAVVSGAMVAEVLKGSDRSFHPMLSAVRPHEGQKEVASLYRRLLSNSQLAYQEMKGHQLRPPGIKVQDGYSLRSIAQYHGVNFEKIKTILQTITINANSVSDNPLWVSPEYATEGEKPWQWISGGNFLAMHMADAMDSLRKIMTQIVKLNDRHLARIVNPNENNGLPPNLSDQQAISGCAFKGVQIQAGMFDVYSTLLSIPVSTFFGVHEEGNQDVTSHALTSGILGLENLRITRYSLAQTFLAIAQAVDLRGGPHLLSPKTQIVYDFIRKLVSYTTKEKPLHNEIETLYQSIENGQFTNFLREKLFKNIE